jgi:tRNA nucleotidyltransferase/poly(A) polymerase
MTNKQAAIKVVKQLHDYGYEALLAGGCVRDMLLGRPASDYDVATSALPEDVIRLFNRTLKVGAKFGVVIVLVKDMQVEVATFRTESGYEDGRHPAVVKFAGAAEDAGRRDFTINGMFYDPVSNNVVDYVNGQADLKKRIIRAIGKPEERFSEDYLRMLRAIRFSTQLRFVIEPATFSAICSNAENITKISGERISAELEGILVDPNRSVGVSLLVESGLAKAIFPGFVDEPVQFAISVLRQLRKKIDFALGLAGLFAGIETKFAVEKCQELKLSRNQNRHVKFLLTNRDKLLNPMSLADLKKLLAEPYFRDLYELQRAIQKAKKSSITALVNIRKRIKALGNEEIKPKPLLTGHDLIRLGAVPGPVLGQLAEEMYIAQLEGQLQTAQQAEDWVMKWLQKHKTFTDRH